jgi:sucrose-6F-phosphate phosphohydrolase
VKTLLICTDLDRTLIPNGRQPESEGARRCFSRFVDDEGVSLAYVSGRHRQLIEQAVEQYQLPVPDYVIADVGSTIYRNGADGWCVWQAWSDEIGGDWQGLESQALQVMLSDIDLLRLQEPEKQNLHKLSFYLPLTADRSAVMEAIQVRLQAESIQANVIWSVDEQVDIGLIDILPVSANKLHAIRFLMQQEGIDETATIFAGDSGNDLDVLLSPIPSVLVANADDEVRQATQTASADSLYLATGGFLGMNGNYSAGILEGVAHFHPEVVADLVNCADG